MTTNPTAKTDTCGVARASLFYHAPILSELGACVLPHGHDCDHRDPWDRTWNVTPPHSMTNTGTGTGTGTDE